MLVTIKKPIMLSVIMLSDVMLNVVMLNVVALLRLGFSITNKIERLARFNVLAY
jgi:hypothetical protein